VLPLAYNTGMERPKKNRAAVALGKLRAKKGDMAEVARLGGKARAKKIGQKKAGEIAAEGGAARAAALTPEQRSAIARKAAAARWGSK